MSINEAGGDINDLPISQTEYPLDAFPQDPTEWRDYDGDGIGNNADPDDDNDGAADALDILPEDPDWSVAVAATASEGAQLIARYEGALTDPAIDFADPRNGATIELIGPAAGQYMNRFGTTPFFWETDSEGWLRLEADLNDLSLQSVFELRVSALGDLITEGLMNTLAINPDYAANLFEVREMVAEVRLH